jgi:hypothetical protein
LPRWLAGGGEVLAVEYDVRPDGQIELVALINVVDEEGSDPDGEAWLVWRKSHEDGGLGCAPVPPAELARMEATEDPEELRGIVESVILADRRSKEEIPT